MNRRPVAGWKSNLLMGGGVGVIYFGVSLFWVTEVTWVGWVALTLLMACYPAAWVVMTGELWRRLPEKLWPHQAVGAAAMMACGWCALEWVRGWLLTGFPWNPVGASQIKVLVVAQVAELGGVGLVSWVVVFGGAILGFAVRRIVQEAHGGVGRQPRLELVAGLVVVGTVIWFGAGRLARSEAARGTLEVVLVQPRIPQDPWGAGMESREALERQIELTRMALPPGMTADVVIWPETPIPEPLIELAGFEEFARQLTAESARAFVYGTIRREGKMPFNAAVLARSGDVVAQVYDKMHLVMMGEYVPLAEWLPFLRRLVPLGTDFVPGRKPVLLDLPGGWKAAPLICFEDVMPGVVRRFVAQQPDLLLNITNDGWFNDSPQSVQHFQLARMRCIEFRLPMIRVANNGVTGWVDERGVVREWLRDPETGRVDIAATMRTRVEVSGRRETFYARWGDWPGMISALVWVVAGAFWWRRSQVPQKV